MKLGLHLQLPTAADIEQLRSYTWPGNVREMAAVIERAAILGQGNGWQSAQHSVSPPCREGRRMYRARTPDLVFSTLEQTMADHIRIALKRTLGRVEGPQGAARLLGINPHTALAHAQARH